MGWGFTIAQAEASQAPVVADLVIKLLKEIGHEVLKNQSEEEIVNITRDMIEQGKVIAFVAHNEDNLPVGVLTMHDCAAIYAGGLFGELSELYVEREYRSGTVGHGLLNTAAKYGRDNGWSRLEVGLPDASQWNRTYDFYKNCGFVETGPKLKLNLK